MKRYDPAASAAIAPLFLLLALFMIPTACSEAPTEPEARLEPGGPPALATVPGENQPPWIYLSSTLYQADEGQPTTVSFQAGDYDPYDKADVIANVGDVTHVNDDSWEWTWTPPDGQDADISIVLTAVDLSGVTADASFDLRVYNTQPMVTTMSDLPDGPIALGTSFTLDASFTDPAGYLDAPYACVLDLGNGSSVDGDPATVAYGEPCHFKVAFPGAGVYELVVHPVDKDAGKGWGFPGYVVVYDPSAGFVTGGGWFLSEAGMYRPDPTASGPATFGFVARYAKGATVPSGNTEFQFTAGDLRFKSTSYDWLVVTGKGEAHFKGSGLVNGERAPNDDEYRFILGATDTPDGDAVNIRIWWEEEITAIEHVVYEGGNFLVGEYGGGSVVIHAK